MGRYIVLAALCAAAAATSSADTIHLKNGTPVNGEIEDRKSVV